MAEYSTHTVAQLKEILKERGLPTDGKKADLVARLTESDSSAAEPSAAEPSAAEPAPAADVVPAEAVKEPTAEAEPVAAEGSAEEPAKENTEPASQPEKPKTLSPEERKQLAVDLLSKKIKRAEKFGDEASAEAAKKDLARIEKFGVEPGTALAKEIGLVDKQFNNGLGDGTFKKFRRNKKSKKFNKR